jgi:hypothetical protein
MPVDPYSNPEEQIRFIVEKEGITEGRKRPKTVKPPPYGKERRFYDLGDQLFFANSSCQKSRSNGTCQATVWENAAVFVEISLLASVFQLPV